MSKQETESLESLLMELPEPKRSEAFRILYGTGVSPVEIVAPVKALAEAGDFEVAAYHMAADKEQRRAPRRVKIAAIQQQSVLSPSAPVQDQFEANVVRAEQLLEAAGQQGANIACLREGWPMPFFFATREKAPWLEFAEPIDGESTQRLAAIAKKHNMVIVSSILERDEVHNDTIHNTTVIIDNRGDILGYHRKNHIPRVGDFNESTYYLEGDTGHPVFETDFGKIGVNICYGRHHPLNWLMFALNGAEIIFNPSATVGDLSEPLWGIEARCAAIANNVFTVAINRVGTETFPNPFTSGDGQPAQHDFGHFYGSSYITAPDGARTPGLSRVRDGVLVTDVDLNHCRQVRQHWGFPMTRRLAEYGKWISDAARHDYQPQVVGRAKKESSD